MNQTQAVRGSNCGGHVIWVTAIGRSRKSHMKQVNRGTVPKPHEQPSKEMWSWGAQALVMQKSLWMQKKTSEFCITQSKVLVHYPIIGYFWLIFCFSVYLWISFPISLNIVFVSKQHTFKIKQRSNPETGLFCSSIFITAIWPLKYSLLVWCSPMQ